MDASLSWTASPQSLFFFRFSEGSCKMLRRVRSYLSTKNAGKFVTLYSVQSNYTTINMRIKPEKGISEMAMNYKEGITKKKNYKKQH